MIVSKTLNNLRLRKTKKSLINFNKNQCVNKITKKHPFRDFIINLTSH